MIQALYRSGLQDPDTGQSYIHDAMAVAAALDPDLIDWEPHDIEMQTDDVHRGQSRLTRQDGAGSARGRCAGVHAALLRTTGYHQHAEPNQGINNRRTKQKEAHRVDATELVEQAPVQDRDLLLRLSLYFDAFERQGEGWFIFNADGKRGKRISTFIERRFDDGGDVDACMMPWRDFALSAYVREVGLPELAPKVR